jgi:hypothetical protein
MRLVPFLAAQAGPERRIEHRFHRRDVGQWSFGAPRPLVEGAKVTFEV